jgi:hypothetical protein
MRQKQAEILQPGRQGAKGRFASQATNPFDHVQQLQAQRQAPIMQSPIFEQPTPEPAGDASTALAGNVTPMGSSDLRGLVMDLAKSHGWHTGNEWNSLVELLNRESSWNPAADNPSSTAYGLFQFLDSTWAGTGYQRSSDPRIQTLAGLQYILNRYGSPSAALAFHNSHNWY